MPLTKQDTAALRNADALCFDHNADGTGAIRCILRAENSGTGFEQVHTIPALMSSVENYDTKSSTGPFVAFESAQSSRYDDVIQTIVRHMKVGMDFRLLWVRSNNSTLLNDVGLVQDELRIRIGRTNDSRPAETFRVRTAVRKDNSARMIRPTR